jgi:hypothetical protein
MAISGLIGAGAQDALADLLQRQMVEQQLAERTRQFDAELQRRAAEDAQQAEQFQANLGQRQSEQASVDARYKRDDDRADAAAKAAADAAAYDATADANMSELTNDPVQMEAFGIASGKLKPIDVMNIRERRAAEASKETPEQRSAREIADYEKKKGIDRKYDKPTQEKPQYVQVTGPDGKMQMLTPDEIRAQGGVPTAKAGGGSDVKDERVKAYAAEKLTESLAAAKQLKGMVGVSNTGPMGLTKYLPGTPARNLDNVLNQLKAQLAFGELTQMRAASPTGGGLGSITERELDLLGSVRGGLDPLASNFGTELDKVIASLERAQTGIGSKGITAEMPGGGGGAVTVQGPNGKTYSFPDEASAAKFRAAAGIR